MEPIILASASPRRQEILKSLNVPFSIIPDHSPEIFDPALSPTEQAEFFAVKKVKNAVKLLADHTVPWILGADTLISFKDKIFGKPETREDALKMLSDLSGADHQVITAIALFSGKTHLLSTRISVNDVHFNAMTSEEIQNYLDTGEWQGVAGGYRIQGMAACFIDKITGSYSAIMGLSISDFYDILKEQGYKIF